jgi:hypothetical protein
MFIIVFPYNMSMDNIVNIVRQRSVMVMLKKLLSTEQLQYDVNKTKYTI